MRRVAAFIVTVAFSLQTTGCGLLLFPERQGQKGGRIDPGVAILDAAGLIVFIVPGLIAFGVDFITGCIYLPGGQRAAVDALTPRTVFVDPRTLDQATIEGVVERATGAPVRLDAPMVEARVVADRKALQEAVAAML
jgi:hypothetical protein